jgi:hypothetical protein
MKLMFSFNEGISGWNMPFLYPPAIIGIELNNIWSQSPPILFSIILSVVLSIFFVFSLYRLFKNNEQLFFITFLYVALVIAGYGYLSLKEAITPTFSGEGYKAFKLITYFIPLILIITLYYFNDFQKTSQKTCLSHKKAFFSGIIVLLFFGNIWSGFTMIMESKQQSFGIDDDILDLVEIDHLENISSINIQENSFWRGMWIYYFLMGGNKSIYLKYPTYYRSSPQEGEWTLKNNNSDIIHIINKNEKIKINKGYYLEKNNSLDINLNNNGWYDLQSDENNFWRWSGIYNESPSIIIESTKDQLINLDLMYWTHYPDNTLTLVLDNTTITDCINNSYCRIPKINLTSGKHILRLKVKHPTQSSVHGDSTHLGYAFSNITFITPIQ